MIGTALVASSVVFHTIWLSSSTSLRGFVFLFSLSQLVVLVVIVVDVFVRVLVEKIVDTFTACSKLGSSKKLRFEHFESPKRLLRMNPNSF